MTTYVGFSSIRCMKATQQQQAIRADYWSRYRNNMPRHMIALSRHIQSGLLKELMNTCGHPGLKLQFEPFITLVGEQGARITELADQLAVSKQAINQSVNQVEAAGYLHRLPDPLDGRAKKVMLTPRGRQVLEDGAELMREVEEELQLLIGKKQLTRFTYNLYRFYKSLGLPLPGLSMPGSAIGWLLPRLSDYILRRLMELTRQRGHRELKMSFSQVLIFAGSEQSRVPGGRIQEIARVNGVSKQAIGAIATELQLQGYLKRKSDPLDGRQIQLLLTTQGEQLIEDSAASIVELEQEISDQLGENILNELKMDSLELYQALHLEQDVFGPATATARPDLVALAARLHLQLGRSNARALADVLINITEIEQ